MIASAEPRSLTELAELSGRAKSNLSRTLRTMERYGLVTLEKTKGGQVVARVPYKEIVLDVAITETPAALAS
jgi:predicted transcriptional regulator